MTIEGWVLFLSLWQRPIAQAIGHYPAVTLWRHLGNPRLLFNHITKNIEHDNRGMGIVAFFMAMSNSPSYWPLPCGDALALAL
jgi:hypothetical protein